jgi:hypothetical protein
MATIAGLNVPSGLQQAIIDTFSSISLDVNTWTSSARFVAGTLRGVYLIVN